MKILIQVLASQHTDTCEACDLLQEAIQSSIRSTAKNASKKLAECQEKAGHGYSSLRTDINTAKQARNHWLITFDLMQNLPVPTLIHSFVFYLRQLWVCNFGIHNAASNSASTYMRNETICK